MTPKILHIQKHNLAVKSSGVASSIYDIKMDNQLDNNPKLSNEMSMYTKKLKT